MLFPSTPNAKGVGTHLTRRDFLQTGTIAGLGLAGYAATRGRHDLEVVSRTFAIRDLPRSFQGFRFAQISDIHLEEYTEPWFLEKVIDTVNSLGVDLILFTGDLISRGPMPHSVSLHAARVGSEILAKLKCPQRFAILGNHDVAVSSPKTTQALQAAGFQVLDDSFVALDRSGDRVWLCGSRDITLGYSDLSKSIPSSPKAPVIFLVHEPDFAIHLLHTPEAQSINLILSGHSHGGQIRIPFIGPLVLPPLGRRYIQGLYQLAHMQLYVNRGIGTVAIPFRLNCSPEITLGELVSA